MIASSVAERIVIAAPLRPGPAESARTTPMMAPAGRAAACCPGGVGVCANTGVLIMININAVMTANKRGFIATPQLWFWKQAAVGRYRRRFSAEGCTPKSRIGATLGQTTQFRDGRPLRRHVFTAAHLTAALLT